MTNGIRYAYTGNVHDAAGQSTRCHGCGTLLIERDGYRLGRWGLDERGRCAACGEAWPASSMEVQDAGALAVYPVRMDG